MPTRAYQYSTFFPPQIQDGVHTFTFPETKSVDAFDVNQTGAYVVAAFDDPETFNGKNIHTSGFHGKLDVLVDTYGKVKGVKVKTVYITADQYAKLGFPVRQNSHLIVSRLTV